MEQGASQVYLYVYDLTQGMAKSLSPMLIGRTIEGIWHSGIVAFNNEYFFGDGIWNMPPGSTPFGVPTKKILLGETEIDQTLFHEFLSDIKDRFSPITYNVKSHNCNHFTNEASNFLIGSDIPHDILKQAEDLFSTPLGKMVEPMVMQQQDALKQGSNNMFGNESGDIAHALGGMSVSDKPIPGTDKKLLEASSMVDFQTILNQYPGVVVDCWSPTCPPWMKFKPIFAQMAEFYGSSKIKFLTCNIAEAKEIAMNLMVTSIPAFFTFKDGKCTGQFVGADKSKLETLVKKLKSDWGDEEGDSTISSPPSVLKIKYDLGFIQFKPWSTQEILFENISNMSKIANKVKEIVSNIEGDELSDLILLMNDFKMAGLDQNILHQLLISAQKWDENDIFALFDFLRCCFITEKLSKAAVAEEWVELEKALSRIEEICEGDTKSISKQVVNSQMTSTQAICNLFKFKEAYKELYADSSKIERLFTFSAKMLSSSKDKAISAAASIGLNIMIRFDELFINPLEENKELEYEQKVTETALKFDLIEEGSKFYTEKTTQIVSGIENSDTLYRVLMSECRILHCNYKVVEYLAGQEEYVYNHLTITQKYPSGQLNDSVGDLQKILNSYTTK